MHYSLYFPGTQAVGTDHLARCGIADLSRDKSPEYVPLTRGPDGQAGLLAIWRTGHAASDPPADLTPTQEWKPAFSRAAVSQSVSQSDGESVTDQLTDRATDPPAYWIGIDKSKPVRPADIARSTQIAGYWVTLADKQPWYCPAARYCPHRHGLGADGKYSRTIDPAYAAFWESSQRFAEQIFAKLGQLHVLQTLAPKRAPQSLKAEFDLAETFSFAAAALAFNYRLNGELVTRLGLLDDEALLNVVKAAVDLPVLLDVRAQKKTPERVSIPVG